VARYFNGVSQSIKNVLCLQTLWMISKEYQRDLMVEKQQAARDDNKNFWV
jgi:hypothetical protein